MHRYTKSIALGAAVHNDTDNILYIEYIRKMDFQLDFPGGWVQQSTFFGPFIFPIGIFKKVLI